MESEYKANSIQLELELGLSLAKKTLHKDLENESLEAIKPAEPQKDPETPSSTTSPGPSTTPPRSLHHHQEREFRELRKKAESRRKIEIQKQEEEEKLGGQQAGRLKKGQKERDHQGNDA